METSRKQRPETLLPYSISAKHGWRTGFTVRFALDKAQVFAVLGEVHAAVSEWRQLALGPEVGLRATDLDDFAPAFEHAQMEVSFALLGLWRIETPWNAEVERVKGTAPGR